jgi:hypothetical protein
MAKNLHASSMTSILRSRTKNLMARLPGVYAFLSVSTAEEAPRQTTLAGFLLFGDVELW